MNQVPRRAILTFVLVLLMICGADWAFSQATFQVSDAQGTINKDGQTELTGPVSFTVVSGTTVSGTFEITYPLPITNDTTSGITVTGTGILSAATVSAIPSARLVIVTVPAGAGPGAKLLVTGVRIAAAGASFTRLEATVSGATGNFIAVGQNKALIVDKVSPGMTVTTSSSSSFTIVGGLLVDLPPTFTIAEAYPDSFSSSVGLFGQTTPTQVVFQVVGLPDNVSLTFPATATSPSTAATLTTPTGLPVILTNQSAPTAVYLFTSGPNSLTVFDQFTITPMIGFSGLPDTGTTFIQVAMGPIGAAIPNASLPSTAIPRYADNFQPVINTPTSGGTTLVFPIPTSDVSPSVLVTNVATGTADLTFSALRPDGTTSTSPFSPILNGRETRLFTLSQLFGAGTTTATVGAVVVQSLNTRLTGSLTGVSPGGKTLTPAQPESTSLTWPLNLVSSSREALVSISNSGNNDSSVSLTLRSSTGQTIATTSRSVSAHTTLRSSLLDLFSATAASVPVDCYITGTASQPVRGTILTSPQELVEEVAVYEKSSAQINRYPYFVYGGGYNTVLTLVNTTNVSARVTLTLVRTDGSAFLTPAPLVRVIQPLNRLDLNFQSLFGMSASFVTGSLQLSVEKEGNTNPFAASPELAGTVRTTTLATSTVAPLFLPDGTDFFLAPGQETGSVYTGIAIHNNSFANATITLDIFNSSGTLLGTQNLVLGAQALTGRLLRDLVPESLGQDNTLVRVRSTAPMKVLGFRGSTSFTDLFYVGGQ